MLKKVDKVEMSEAEVVDYLKIDGSFSQSTLTVVERKLAAATARANGIKLTSQQLQAAVDTFRKMKGLEKASATQEWLKNNNISVEALEQYIEENVLKSKLKDLLEKKTNKSKYLKSCEVGGIVREQIYTEWLHCALAS